LVIGTVLVFNWLVQLKEKNIYNLLISYDKTRNVPGMY